MGKCVGLLQTLNSMVPRTSVLAVLVRGLCVCVNVVYGCMVVCIIVYRVCIYPSAGSVHKDSASRLQSSPVIAVVVLIFPHQSIGIALDTKPKDGSGRNVIRRIDRIEFINRFSIVISPPTIKTWTLGSCAK
jgi:hypothetical protein